MSAGQSPADGQLVDSDLEELRPIRTDLVTNVQGQLTAVLRDAILSGRLRAGMRLRQADLAQRFDVSSTPVRESLRELAAEGLVDIRPYIGATVHEPTLKELQNIYDIRLALTPLAVRLAVENATPQALAYARTLLRSMSEPGLESNWVQLNREFHRILDSPIPNVHLLELQKRFGNLAQIYVHLSLPSRTDGRDQAMQEHRELLRAFETRDVEAATRVTVTHFSETLKGAWRALEPDSATT